MDAIDVLSKILAAYNLLLIIMGTLLNPIVCYVCLRSSKLRTVSTFKFLSIIAINDIVSLYMWNQEHVTQIFFNIELISISLFYCRYISAFLQYFTLQFSSWMWVSISLDRLLSLSLKHWSRVLFNGFRPFMYMATLAVILVAINFSVLFHEGYIDEINGTTLVVCYEDKENMFQWNILMAEINLYLYAIIPYAMLIILNFSIIYKATDYQRKHATPLGAKKDANLSSRRSQMTFTILLTTFLFIAFSLPDAIVSGYFYPQLIGLRSGRLAIQFLDCLTFTFPSLNFFTLLYSNRAFARELKVELYRLIHFGNMTDSGSNQQPTIRSITNLN